MSLRSLSERFFALPHTHGLLVRRHGATLLERYRDPCGPADRHQLFSLSKSFVSTAVGIAIGEGLLSLDDTLVSFFPEFLSARVTDRMRRVTLRHLLTMSTGHASCALFGEHYSALGDGRHFANNRPLVQNILEDALPYEPGTRFVYNSGATYLLSAVLLKATGAPVSAYLRPRFFDPVGIGPDVVWDRTADGIEKGGWGLSLSVREVAAAAEVWLHGGLTRDGRRLIPESYMREALGARISNGDPAQPSDWSQGYGYQFWCCRHGAFRGDGASGQFAVLFPAFDAIAVGTAGLHNMQRELDVLWDELLPALEADEGPVADLPPATFPCLVRPPDPAPVPPPAPVAFRAEANPLGVSRVAFLPEPDGATLELTFADGRVDSLGAGLVTPKSGRVSFVDPAHHFAAHGRVHWPAPSLAHFDFVLPCTTSLFACDLDFAARRLHLHTDIFFAHPWLCDVDLALAPADSLHSNPQ